ncbi:MAG TPA: sigma-70 family RNA polymerase sigma factor [Solirubrobacterales bacterium]|nr:sigma-70 family RNA polymerase sigma factor [Solirubrobacterales bacterium]
MSASQSDSSAIAASLLDPGAFGAIFERHYDAVHGYLRRRLDDARADEIASQTFLVAFDGRSRFDRSRGDARPWLFGIATNLAHNHRRHELVELRAMAAMRPEAEAAVDGVEARVDAERLRGPLARALADLPTEEADVLCLLVWAELSQGEVADALAIPLGTVKSRLSRARGRLRDALGLQPDADSVGDNATSAGGRRWTS